VLGQRARAEHHAPGEKAPRRGQQIEGREPGTARRPEQRPVVGEEPNQRIGHDYPGAPVGFAAANIAGDEPRAADLVFRGLQQELGELPRVAQAEVQALAGDRMQGLGCVADERQVVASVFLNRLKLGMRLQSDPTIIYGLVGGKGTLGHPITRSEKETPTPYNTYMIDGLPPGPIANPGRASLEAAANPARTKEMFFVADGTGGHVFAETYDQHLRNVAKLRALEHADRSSAAATSFQPEDPGVRPILPAAPKAQPKRNPTPAAPSAATNANAKKQ